MSTTLCGTILKKSEKCGTLLVFYTDDTKNGTTLLWYHVPILDAAQRHTQKRNTHNVKVNDLMILHCTSTSNLTEIKLGMKCLRRMSCNPIWIIDQSFSLHSNWLNVLPNLVFMFSHLLTVHKLTWCMLIGLNKTAPSSFQRYKFTSWCILIGFLKKDPPIKRKPV